MTEINSNTVNNDKIRKVLFNEISFLIAVAGVIIGIVLFITNTDADLKSDIGLIKKDISVIRDNELAHINEIIKENRSINSQQDKQLQELNRKVDRILYILENKK